LHPFREGISAPDESRVSGLSGLVAAVAMAAMAIVQKARLTVAGQPRIRFEKELTGVPLLIPMIYWDEIH
jgi:hypothetical protein